MNENLVDKIKDFENISSTLRMLSVDAVQKANSGHPGLPLGAADLMSVLWMRNLKHAPDYPTWANRDRFVLSAGHGSALLYSLLHLFGYSISLDDLKEFRQWGSKTPGHPEYDPELGIETTSGPLGQGLGIAVGLALAERWLASYFNKPEFPVIDHFTYVLASDGDLMEGISHEAASMAGHWGLGRLIVLHDDNKISIDGTTDLSCSDDIRMRFESYGWHVLNIDGHNLEEIDKALKTARAVEEKPTLIMCKTHLGFGSPRVDTAKVHGSPLGVEDLNKTKQAFQWPSEPSFYIPDVVKVQMEDFRKNANAAKENWDQMLQAYFTAYPEMAAEWDLWQGGAFPEKWDEGIPEFSKDKPIATRAASGMVLNALCSKNKFLLGGSADLTGSNNTRPKDFKAIQKGDYDGRYIHFGIREHGMGAVLNGLCLHGLRSYGGTFLVFSDYMRPSIRLAALMGLPAIYVFTHDSIGLGEDGPTHQPIEQLTALRVIPNLTVIRPADANETAQAWRAAMLRKDGPTALILTRQALPLITPKSNDLDKGAYILAQPDNVEKPDVILVATGSEVSLAYGAYQELMKKDIAARVVSMPSWELFNRQTASYREQVLPKDIPCISIEAGSTLAWAHFTGNQDSAIGLDRFGASAPYKQLFEEFGFTIENILKIAEEKVC